MSGWIDAERVTGVAQRIPAPQDRLAAASLRHCRPDEGQKREVAGHGELVLRIGHLEKAAKLSELLLDRPASVNRALDLDFNVARARFAGIAMNQPDKLRIRLPRAVAIDMKGNFFAGTHRETVRVAEDLLLGHCYFSVRSWMWRRKTPWRASCKVA
jgi:hypothetical protein